MSQVTYVAAGAFQNGAGAITVPVPAGIVNNDILILVIHTSNQASTITSPAGWTQVNTNVAGSTITLTNGAVGTAVTAGAIGSYIFWKRTTGTEASVVTNDSGDHQLGQMFAFRNCAVTGGPIDAFSITNVTTASTTYTCPTATTLSPDNLVVLFMFNAVDNNTASSPATVTNANLTTITGRANNNANTGTGGGFSVVTGVLKTRGTATGTSSGTGTSSVQVTATMVLRPEKARTSLIL